MTEANHTQGESVPEILVHAGLLSHAREVPHECNDPKCPGNANRLKLAAFDGLLEACKAYLALYCESDMAPEDECADLYSQIRGVVAEVEGET